MSPTPLLLPVTSDILKINRTVLKWQKLILSINGKPQDVEFEDLDGWEVYPGYVDDVPNPASVLKMATRRRCLLETLSLEMITGRWISQVMTHHTPAYLSEWMSIFESELSDYQEMRDRYGL